MPDGKVKAGGAADGMAKEVEVGLEGGRPGVEGLREGEEGGLGGFPDGRGGRRALAIAVAGIIDEQEAVARIARGVDDIEPIEGEGAVAGKDDPEMARRLVREEAGRKVECLLETLRGGEGERNEGGIDGRRAGAIAAGMVDEAVLKEEEENDNGEKDGDEDADHAL
jgi:hypothetical protein